MLIDLGWRRRVGLAVMLLGKV